MMRRFRALRALLFSSPCQSQRCDQPQFITAVVEPLEERVLLDAGDDNVVMWDFVTGDFLVTEYDHDRGQVDVRTFGSLDEREAWFDFSYGDFNGDSLTDVLVRRGSDGAWIAGLSNGTEFVFSRWGRWGGGAVWTDVVTGDFDGDGLDDVLGRNGSSGAWWLARSTGSSIENQYWGHGSSGENWSDAIAGDFNGDGRDDVARRDANTGSWWVGRSSGDALVTERWGAWSKSQEWDILGVVNFGNDGTEEIIGRNERGHFFVNRYQPSQNRFTPQAVGRWGTGTEWTDIQLTDRQVFGRTESTGAWWVATLAPSQPDDWHLVNEYIGRWSQSVPWENVVVADYDLNSRADIIGQNAAAGTFWSWTSQWPSSGYELNAIGRGEFGRFTDLLDTTATGKFTTNYPPTLVTPDLLATSGPLALPLGERILIPFEVEQEVPARVTYTIAVSEKPDGAARPFIGTFTGNIFWTPDAYGDYEFTVTVTDARGLSDSRTYRLTLSPTRAVVTPGDGSNHVKRERPIRIDFSDVIDASTVNTSSIVVTSRGRQVTGRVEVSSTNRFALFYADAPFDPSTEVHVRVDGSLIRDQRGQLIDADGNATPGGVGRTTFRTLSSFLIPGTALTGRILRSNALDSNGDPVETPIEGVTIRLDGVTDNSGNPITAVTDANGEYTLTSPDGLPAPDFFVVIDGSTAVGVPAGFMFPTLGKPFHSVAGRSTPLSMNGEPMDIFLPLMAAADIVELNSNAPTTVGFGSGGLADLQDLFPDIDVSVWQQAGVTFAPGSARDDAGNAATQGAIVPVSPDRLPGGLPPFLDPRLVISIQAGSMTTGFNDAGGATVFDVPAELSFPNLDGLAPGEQTLIYSFDHDAGAWIVVGTGTVSSDGTMIESDGGVIVAPGWHFVADGVDNEGEVRSHPDIREQAVEFFNAKFDEMLSGAALVGSALDTLIGHHPLVDIPADFVLQGVDDVRDWRHGEELTFRERVQETLDTAFAAAVGAAIPLVGVACDGLRTINFQRQYYSDLSESHEELGELASSIAQWAKDHGYSLPDGVSSFAARTHARLIDKTRDMADRVADAERWTDGACSLSVWFERAERFIEGVGDNLPTIEELQSLAEEAGRSIRDVVRNGSRTLRDGLRSALERVRSTVSELVETATPATLPSRQAWYALELPNGSVVRGRTDENGRYSATLPPNAIVTGTFYDPDTGFAFREQILTGRSGTRQQPTHIVLGVDDTDSDADGLSDTAEAAIGTSPTAADTDNDGVSDFSEIEQGLDPLSGLPAITGAVANVGLEGEAREVVVTGTAGEDSRRTAFVATGSHGLAIVDVTQFDEPIVLAELDLPGTAVDIAVDSRLGIAAVAASEGGLHLIDISDPSAPVLLRTIDFETGSVDVWDGLVYRASGTKVTAHDLLTGRKVSEIDLQSRVEDVAIERGVVFAAIRSQLVALSAELVELSRATSATSSVDKSVFVGGGIAYVGIDDRYETFDVSDPPQIARLDREFSDEFRGVAANGSGLLIAASDGNGADTVVEVHDVSNPSDLDDSFLTEFVTPGDSQSVTIAGGLAFVADGSGGLTVVNYLSFDANGVPPAVTIDVPAEDIDPDTNGTQVLEGSTVPVFVDVTDDVQVRSVELFIDGEAVARDLAFPFDLSFIAPITGGTPRTVDVQVRVTDTGGNATLSDVVTLDVVPDTFAPNIVSIDPLETRGGFLGHELEFQVFHPNLQTPFTNPLRFTVNDNVEVFDLREQLGSAPWNLIEPTIDVTGRSISVSFESANTYASGSFTGFRFIDVNHTVDRILNVTVNQADNSIGLTDDRIIFGENGIWVNLRGIFVSSTRGFTLDIEFEDTGNTPPPFMQEGDRSLSINFDESLDAASVQNDQFVIEAAGNDGVFGTTDDFVVDADARLFSDDSVVRLASNFDAGLYRLVIDAANVTDRAGNALGDADLVHDFEVTELVPLFTGESPTILIAIDLSTSTRDTTFNGTAVGNVNGDSRSNSILDAQLASIIALTRELNARGYGDSASIGIVGFSDDASLIDLSFVDGEQTILSPAADLNANGIPDIIETVREIQAIGGTNFATALDLAADTFAGLGTSVGARNLVFLSDGRHEGTAAELNDAADRLRDLGVNSIAYGIGGGVSLSDLQVIDPRARIATSIDEFIESILGIR